MRFGLLTVLLSFMITPSGQSNCWRGITPLRSTCEDIKNSLNINTCSMPLTRYSVPELRVMIGFAQGCDEAPQGGEFQKEP